MSVAERGDDPGTRPTRDLGCLVDDPDDPREVTVFSTTPGEDITTHWLTIDADHAVPLDELA